MDFRVITLIFIGSYVIRASILRSNGENDSIKNAAEDKPAKTELKERQKDPESSADETKGLKGLKMRSKESKAFLRRQDDPRRSEEDAWGYAVMGRGHQKLVRLDDPRPVEEQDEGYQSGGVGGLNLPRKKNKGRLMLSSKDSKAFLKRQDDPRPVEEQDEGYQSGGVGGLNLPRKKNKGRLMLSSKDGKAFLKRQDDPQPGRRKGGRYGRRYGSRYGGRYGEHHYPEHYYPYNRRYGVGYNEEGGYHEEKKVVKLDDPQPVKEQGKKNKGRRTRAE